MLTREEIRLAKRASRMTLGEIEDNFRGGDIHQAYMMAWWRLKGSREWDTEDPRVIEMARIMLRERGVDPEILN